MKLCNILWFCGDKRMEQATPPEAGPEQVKKTSPGRDLAVVGCLVAVMIAVLAGIAVLLLRFAIPILKGKPAPTEAVVSSEVSPPTPPEPPPAPPPEKKEARPRKERSPPAARPEPPQKSAPAVQSLDLAENPKKAGELAGISITGEDISHLKLEISDARQSLNVRIPIGMMVAPVETTNMCPFVVYEAQAVDVPLNGSAAVSIKAAGTDFKQFLTPVAGVRFQPADKPANALLNRFLSSGATRTSSWNMVQAGIWVIENNIGREDLQGFMLTYPDPAAPGGTRSAPVVSYTEIKRVEAIISSLGANPDSYKLFVQEREERQRLLAQLNFENPSPDCQAILNSKALARYTGDSEVENILRLYLTRHKRFSVRRSALENLVELGTKDSSGALFQKLSYGDQYYKFLAAFELFKRGDERCYPLLAIQSEDPMFADFCAKPLADAILKKTGAERNEGESQIDYWTRTVGWTAFPGKPHEAEQLRRSIEQYTGGDGATDSRISQVLGLVTSDDDNVASQACSQLRAFPRNRVAFDTLCRMATTHRSQNVRRNAIYSLGAFGDFNPREVCLATAKSGDDQQIYAAIDLACAIQFDGVEEFLRLLTQHRSIDVRRSLAQNLGHALMPEAETPLLLLARTDADEYVRSSALRSLGAMKSPESLKLAVKLLSSGTREDKQSAFQCLQQWRDDSQALDILERYRNDPDIGTWISQHLSNYGRNP